MIIGAKSKATEATIVVVDDEPSIRELLVASLHFAGYEVETAASGSEAIEVISRTKPDMIILDVMLPDIDGFTVTRRIRQEGITAPVLFLSLIHIYTSVISTPASSNRYTRVLERRSRCAIIALPLRALIFQSICRASSPTS